MEAKLKHLELLQAIIARMSKSSFAFKGWSVTIASALFAFAAIEERGLLILVAIYATALFWGLDGYYLWLERRFIDLYQDVVDRKPEDIDFSMAIDKSNGFGRWLNTCCRPHLIMFYGTMLVVQIVSIILTRKPSS